MNFEIIDSYHEKSYNYNRNGILLDIDLKTGKDEKMSKILCNQYTIGNPSSERRKYSVTFSDTYTEQDIQKLDL